MKNTKVVSAFPACGKSYFFNNRKDLACLDSDSSEFSWVIDENGNKVRNPEFPANYIKHIKENLGKADFIFVSSHLQVRQALNDNNIEYVTVYPETSAKSAWLQRMKDRGNDENFIKFQDEHFDEFTRSVDDEPHGQKVIRISGKQYLGDIVESL